jgi:hypothetical protein
VLAVEEVEVAGSRQEVSRQEASLAEEQEEA